jgi:sodium-dependent dicarboxylate transporter 2/3/5
MQLLRILVARKWLIAGGGIGLILLLLPPPEGLSPQGMRALAILATAVIFLIAEPIPLPATALLIAFGQVVLELGQPNEIARSFMSDAVFFIMGSLMISVALIKQKLDVRIAFALLRLTGPKVGWIVFGLSATSALLASFIGEHTVAAMMLPVALGIIAAVERDQPKVRNLAVLLLLAIAYGCAIAALGTPSGGARNAILIDYWRGMFDIHIDYATWMAYAYPLVLLQLPFVSLVLLSTFRPEIGDLRRALVRLRREVRARGQLSPQDFQVLALFLLVLFSWITLSDRLGIGVIAITGASLYLVTGLVKWEDLNSGVNWGVIWLYAASISLGFQLKATGAAPWLAERFLWLLGDVHGLGLLLAICLLMVIFASLMGSGAAVAVVGAITLQMADISGESVIAAGFATAIGSAFTFLTIIGNPAALIVYGSGHLRPSDFLRAGPKLLAISVIITMALAWLYWPWLGL